MKTTVGIAAAAFKLPARKRQTPQLFEDESVPFSAEMATRLGIDEVPVCDGEPPSALALSACQEALRRAELEAGQLDVIVDYSVLPQEFLVPAWNMSNKLQHELGAAKAFTVGFSGGGASNFLVALSSAVSLLQANEKLTSALLVAADVAIPGNRLLNSGDPVTILGDSAGAMVLKKGVTGNLVLDTEIHSDASYHDVCYIPGGALAHPDEPELYRMHLDKQRFDAAPKMEKLRTLLDSLLERHHLRRSDVAFALYPNLSAEDRQQLADVLGLRSNPLDLHDLRSYGHLQGTDFIVNYRSMVSAGLVEKDQYFIAASHGMGFVSGVTLFQL